MRLTFVTIGARDVATLRAFYRRWGWPELPGADDTFALFDAGGVRLALYAADLLRREAAPDGDPLPEGAWRGTTLAVNVGNVAEVDAALGEAVAAGARPVGGAVHRQWGGYSGYVADPEGNRWEIAWAPGYEPG